MKRLYAIGILIIVLVLNIPALRGDMQAKLTIYQPYAIERINAARNKAEPALLGLLTNIAQHSQTVISDNGRIIRTINPSITDHVDTSNTWTLDRKSSITVEQFNAILQEYNSPATGVGAEVVTYANSKDIDAAYILYMFIQESTAGTNKQWAGYKPDGTTTKNPGNIICAGYHTCYNGFREYSTWSEGFKAMIDNLNSYKALGDTTIDEGINRWSPPVENDTNAYVTNLKEHVSTWRNVNKGEFVATTSVIGRTTISKPLFAPSDEVVVSIPLPLNGCTLDTVPNALLPSKGLQQIVIPPNSDWSFNEQWVIVDEKIHYCGGVPYGGICDMAARYNNAARLMGLTTLFQQHPGLLNGVTSEDNVVIWSIGSLKRGGQDVIIQNKTNRTAYLEARIENNIFTVKGWYK